jgi:AcrR family transcriptional regulator
VATIAFVADGYAGASMQQIAERAGVTKPVVYALYRSKEELFAAVVDQVSAGMAERIAVATAERGTSQLGAGIRAFLEYSRAHRGLWGPIFSSVQHGAVLEAVRRLQDRQVELVAAALRRGHEDAGLEPQDDEIEALAHLVSGAVQSVGQWWARHPGIGLDEVANFLEAAIAPSLATIRTDRTGAPWFDT